MAKISNKILGYVAAAAEEAFLQTSGAASHCGAYEPKMSESAKACKASHISKIELLYDRLVK